MNGPAHQLAGAVADIVISGSDHEDKAGYLHYPIASGAVAALLGSYLT